MKIAYLVETKRMDPARGGTERYTWDFTSALVAAGHEVHLFGRAGCRAAPGVTLRVVRSGGVGRAWRTLAFGREVERMLARETFDVVHGIGWTWSQDVFQPHSGVYLANREARGAPSLGLRLSLLLRTFLRIERRQYGDRKPLLYIALSDKVRRDMQRFFDVPSARIRIVYNGVDTERFRPENRERFRADARRRYGIGDDEVVLLIVAHNFALKGVNELVECVTEKGFPACRLLVAGRGKSRRLAARAESRAPGRVLFTGAVDDAAPLYAAADAYVHPTHYDPCSLVVLEALASGLPVVTTRASGSGELMTEGREGFVIPSARDANALRDALTRLFDPPRRREMGAAARTLALEHTLGHNIRGMLAVYDEILRLKGRA